MGSSPSVLNRKVGNILKKEKKELQEFLCELIRFPSTAGNEKKIQNYLLGRFKERDLKTRLVPIKEIIRQNPYYTGAEEKLNYKGRYNLIALRKGIGDGRSIILNTHSDVVPAKECKDAFKPKIRGDIIYGRGAVDAKGQIMPIYFALKTLEELGIKLKGDILTEIVIEEEVGGNGSLALILDGYQADGVIVFEGSELNVHPANRGAIWFRLVANGKSVHMGRTWEGVNAIEKAMKVISLFRKYEKKLIAESKGHPLFREYKQPVQINIGMISGGDWPSTVPGKAVVEGGVGFLPNKRMEAVKEDLRNVILSSGDQWLKEHFILEFPKLHNAAYQIPTNHSLPVTMYNAALKANLPSKITGYIVSCDARLFNEPGHMPVIVFGPGSISKAHSTQENIRVSEILKATEALIYFLMEWCGVAE